MNSGRWRQIERICNAAMELEPADRSRYVQRACGQDSELQEEVQRLLALQSNVSSFM